MSIPLSWLGEPREIAEIEAMNSGSGRPFNHMNGEWEALKGLSREGDRFHMFRSPAETWRRLGGRAGVALVRDGEVIGSMITMMN